MQMLWMGTVFNLDTFSVVQSRPDDGCLVLFKNPDGAGAEIKIGKHPKVIEALKTFDDAVKNSTEVAFGIVLKAMSDDTKFLDLSGTMNGLQMRTPEQQAEFEKANNVTEANFQPDGVA